MISSYETSIHPHRPGRARSALRRGTRPFVHRCSHGRRRIPGEAELPFIIGGEGAGHVTEVGDGVEAVKVGDAVLVPAGCVEEVVVAANRVTPIPQGTDLEAAASFRSNYATALYGMQRGRLKAGETLLVHGAPAAWAWRPWTSAS